MAEFKLSDDGKTGFINSVKMMWIKLDVPTVNRENDNLEYTISLVVDEDTADSFGEMFPKNKIKKMKTSEFIEKYGESNCIDPSAKNQYTINLKQRAQYTDRNTKQLVDRTFATGRPKVLIKNPATCKLLNIAATTKIANGAFGDVSFEYYSNSRGTFPSLKAVRLERYEEYKTAASNPWGEEEEEAPVGVEEAPVAAPAPAGDFDDDIPF